MKAAWVFSFLLSISNNLFAEDPDSKKMTIGGSWVEDGTFKIDKSDSASFEVGKSLFDGKTWVDGRRVYYVGYFSASDGIRIPYLAILPKHVESKALPAVISYPGSEPGGVLHGDFLSTLAERGEAIVFSIGSRGVTPLPLNDEYMADEAVMTRDVDKVLSDSLEFRDFVKEKKGVVPNQISVCGVSQGGYVALDIASKRETEGCFVISGQLADWKSLITTQFLNSAKAWTSMVDLNGDGQLNREEYSHAKEMGFEKLKDKVPAELRDQLSSHNLDGMDTMLSTWLPKDGNRSVEDLLADLKKQSDDMWESSKKTKQGYYAKWVALPSGQSLVLRMKQPTFIYHGGLDSISSVTGFKNAQEAVELGGQTNVQFKLFEDKNHFLTKGQRTDEDILNKRPCKSTPAIDSILSDMEGIVSHKGDGN